MATVTAPNTADGSEITVTLSDFSSVTAVTIAGIAITGYSFNGTDTLTIPSQDYYLAEVSGSAPIIGQDVTIEVTGLDDLSAATSATDTFQITPADGWAATELTSIDYTEVISAIESEVGVTIAIGDSFYYEQVGGDDPDTGGTLIGADGLFEFSSDFRLILIQGGSSTEAADWYVIDVYSRTSRFRHRPLPWQRAPS